MPRVFSDTTARSIKRSVRRGVNVALHKAKLDPEHDIHDGRDRKVLSIAHQLY